VFALSLDVVVFALSLDVVVFALSLDVVVPNVKPEDTSLPPNENVDCCCCCCSFFNAAAFATCSAVGLLVIHILHAVAVAAFSFSHAIHSHISSLFVVLDDDDVVVGVVPTLNPPVPTLSR